MQVEAIYDQGTLKFSAPVRFIKEHFKVQVTIPEDVLVSTLEQQESTPSDRLDSIIGQAFRQNNKGKPSVNTKALWHAHLEEKHLGR